MVYNILVNSNFQLTWTAVNCLIAIIALRFSIKTYNRNKKVTEKTLNKKFFEDIFSDYIVSEIPKELRKIENDKSKFTDNCKEFNTMINEILDKSIFYKFFEPEFYERIRDILIELDDKSIEAQQIGTSNETLVRHKEIIYKLVNDLYQELKKYYSEV